ncbi:hypothetical protein AQUCO_07500028v1 [Aquilegia coerulea]|uniref:phenylalanine--tRNA ligase n=1 Tax=Aquilegia coerulea TaxID=218851 RepID=A0A2G5C974_AQUCA|nr:hypothetical protein AQUCO_07500028v1 [Aquilegia coerulea]
MPKVSVGRDRLFEALGKEYTQEEFEDLCFEFGLELDDVATEEDEVIYKVEVAANRYDLLCFEGLVRALRIFKELDQIPKYSVFDIPRESMLKIHVKPETALVRPYVVSAVLRDITFDQASYKSFIDLQDMLHQNICRGRTLVAIGTHDLDTIQGPFTYEALPPTEINFVPLKQVKSFRGDELMKFYESDMKLKKFLHIIEKSPVFPVIYDCNRKFEVEPVEVISSDGHSCVYPDLSAYNMEVPLSKITGRIGVSADANQVISLLNRMQLLAEKSVLSGDLCSIIVSVPPTRSDVLEACDVAEDFAIAYGFDNILAQVSSSTQGGGEQSLSQISNLIRLEFAMCGFTEVLTWILCSYKDITSMLNKKDNNSTSVKISNPRSADFEVSRTTLMPGLLKTVRENNHHPKPIKIFEVGDVVLLNEMNDVGARNRHHLAALFCDDHSGFEVIHGLVQRIMEVMDIPCDSDSGYCIKDSDGVEEGEFLPGSKGSIIHKGESVGSFGIVHPEVLGNFKISFPCSYMEIDLQCFFN